MACFTGRYSFVFAVKMEVPNPAVTNPNAAKLIPLPNEELIILVFIIS